MNTDANPNTQVSPAAPAVDMFDLRALLRILRASKFLIIAVTAIAVIAANFFADTLTPLYRAGVTILVEPDRRNVVDIDRVAEGLVTTDDQTLQTEADLMASRGMARRVVERLDLLTDPNWNVYLPAPEADLPDQAGFARDIFDLGVSWLLDLVLGEAEAEVVLVPPDPVVLDQIANAFQSGLAVRPARDSRILTVEYVSPDPQFAAAAADTTARLYIDSQLREKGDTTDQAAVWLQQRVAETQARLLDADRKLEQFRRDSGLTTVGTTLLPAQQLAEFSSELSRARADLALSTARHEQVQQLIAGADISASVPVLASSLIESLRVQEVTLTRRLAELRSRFRDGHPDISLVRAELADLRGDITVEMAKVAVSLSNEADLARARVAGLQAEVARRQAALDELTESDVTLRELQSEADANRALFETLLARLKETGVQDGGLQRPDIRIVDAAVIPSFPFFPRKKVILAMAFASAFGLSILFVLVREFLHPGFRSAAQVEAHTGRPLLAMLPHLGRRARARALRPRTSSPGHMYNEALRTLRTNLSVLNAGTAPRVIMVTSSVPDEGKTSTALSIAAQAADAGRRVVVVECDFRNANVGVRIGIPDTIGLAEYLEQDTDVADIISEHLGTGVDFITAGSLPHQPGDVLAAPRMTALLRTLRETYDLVILDTPPLLAVADAAVLMRAVDAVVYLVRWEKTARASVATGLRMITEAGAPLTGIVLSRVNIRKHAKYADGAGLSLDRAYHRYYAEA